MKVITEKSEHNCPFLQLLLLGKGSYLGTVKAETTKTAHLAIPGPKKGHKSFTLSLSTAGSV